MIGGWVLTLDSTHKEQVYAQIWAIEEGQTSILVKKDNCNWFVDIDWLEPIPLTPEILEKNGFVKQGFDGWEIDHKNDDGIMDWMALWRNDYIRPHLLIKSFVSLLGSFSSFGINYVHQLQHILRDCGIEKKIEL